MTILRRNLLAGLAATGAVPAPASSSGAVAAPGTPDLSGRTILITGCSSGFGRLGAEHYARCGAQVIATMRGLPRPEAGALQDLARRDGLALTVIELDVRDDASVRDGIAAALEVTAGALDVVVNNAGVALSGPIEVLDTAAIDLVHDTNVMGVLRVMRHTLPVLRARQGGLLVQMSSQLGRLVAPAAGWYGVSKFAVEALSEQAAYELVRHGIDVCLIQPGGYPTQIWHSGNALSRDLKSRLPAELAEAYPELVGFMGHAATGGQTDPMDVPRAIASVIAMRGGTRPLRVAVHPTDRPHEPVNAAAREAQLVYLGTSPVAPWVRSVLD